MKTERALILRIPKRQLKSLKHDEKRQLGEFDTHRAYLDQMGQPICQACVNGCGTGRGVEGLAKGQKLDIYTRCRML